ncbi:hypothetical protein [Alcaligenes faecalis]|uniref:Uncharacterized protein n=1 Tax=Alcaligenes faecalis TaxID=511 RepID=A0AAE9H924_ALCFA|nr:hypothetical protein [Alcaligenes faecalis]UPL20206.1 hypothetical protein MXF72_12300 [Alcaligenes faecalis]
MLGGAAGAGGSGILGVLGLLKKLDITASVREDAVSLCPRARSNLRNLNNQIILKIEMIEARIFDTHKTVSEMRQKYVYFLLAAVGACIGFAVTQTSRLPLSIWSIPLAPALILWGASFLLGCRYIEQRANVITIRALLLERRQLELNNPNTELPPLPDTTEDLEAALKTLENRSSSSYKYQLVFFVSGTCFFLLWHIADMWRRIPEHMCLWV